MTEFRIDIENGKAYIYTPYNAEFVAAVKEKVGGRKWDSSKRCWTVPESAVTSIREIMMDIYGRTDISVAAELVNVRVTMKNRMSSDYRTGITLFGKAICSAFGRDSGARVEADVAFIHGTPDSAGSAKNWYTVIPEDAIFTVSNVVKSMITEDDYYYRVEFINKQKDKKTALLVEREQLLARLAEIEKQLDELNQ